jgi:hypothetical protein
MIKVDAKRFGKRIVPEALYMLAELFLVNGDLSAFLYTGSQVWMIDRRRILSTVYGCTTPCCTTPDVLNSCRILPCPSLHFL